MLDYYEANWFTFILKIKQLHWYLNILQFFTRHWRKINSTWYFRYKLFGHQMAERMKMMMTISQEIISKLPLAQIFWNVKLHLFFYCLCVAPYFQILKRKRIWILTIVLMKILLYLISHYIDIPIFVHKIDYIMHKSISMYFETRIWCICKQGWICVELR